MTRTVSGYQQEAIKLRRDKLGSTTVGSFDEAIVEADAAAAERKWDDAVRGYETALQFAAKLSPQAQAKIKDRVKAVREQIAQIKLLLARQLFRENKLPECLEALKLVQEKYRETTAAPEASALAVTALFNQFVGVPNDAASKEKKKAAMERVIAAAHLTADNWPGRPEADDARMDLGILYIFCGDTKQALKQFDSVNPKSERYPKALYMGGLTHWQLYFMEKQKRQEGGKFDEKAMAENRKLAEEKIGESYAAQRKTAPPNQPMPELLTKTELLFAEIKLEGGDGKAAAPLFQPLIDAVKANRAAFDPPTVQKIFLGGVKSYINAGDLDKAGDVGMLLVELGADSDAVNRELINFAKLLDNQRKKADADLTNAVGPADQETARARLSAMNDLLGKILTKLANREKMSAASMVWMADTSSKVGLDDAAEKQCNLFLQRVKDDPDFAKKGSGKAAEKARTMAVTKVRTILIGILVKKQKFDEALNEVQQLIKDQPRALEPKLEKCRLLQAWGEKDPKHFGEALGAWDTLRRQLDAYMKNPKFSAALKKEFYEVVYSEAACVYSEAARLDKAGNKAEAGARALDGEKLLKYALFNSANLDGPDTLAKYNALMDKFELLQGRKPVDRKAKKT